MKKETNMNDNKQKPGIFISYSHEDEPEKDQLMEHLSVLTDNNIIDVWHDRKIETGDPWNDEIKTAIDRANMAVLLISKKFINSDFIKQEELPYILERMKNNGLKIYPIILGYCMWQEYTCNDFKLKETQVKPLDGKPLLEFEVQLRDKIIIDIVTDIKGILLNPQHQQKVSVISAAIKDKEDSNTGDIIPLLCDRDQHAGAFIDFFINERKKCKKTPQFYFILGLQSECPLSMIQRFRYHEVKQYFDSSGETIRSPRIKPIKWPESGNFDFRKKELKKNLFSAITNNHFKYMENDYQLTDLYQSNYFEKYKNHVVLIPHTLTADQWDQALMNWYITEYWFDPTCILDDMPQFLLFFSITCASVRKSVLFPINLQKRIHKKLIKFSKTLDKTCPHYLFEPLNQITKEHVRSWFREHFEMQDSEIENEINILFENLPNEINMLTVEKRLMKIWKEMKKKKGETYVYSQA